MRISVPRAAPCWSGLCCAVTMGVLTQPAWGALSQWPALQVHIPACPCPAALWTEGKAPDSLGCSKDAVEFPPPSPVPFRAAKLPCPTGRIPNVKIYLEPNWPNPLPSSPAVLGQFYRGPVPQPFPEQWSPHGQFSFLKACTHEFLTPLPQHCPGTLDHLASLIIIALFWCAVQWSVQVHKHHRPFGDRWNVFSRIRVIQTSCTCRLKSCNRQLRARTAVSVCQWLLNHTPESLQTLRLICTHSPAACQQVLHFQPWKYI